MTSASNTDTHIITDNGKQFISKEFTDLVRSYGITNICTAVHSLQANASARVNQSILVAKCTYLSEDLRSSVHSSLGVTPYFALLGTNMISLGSVYPLARKLQLLEDTENH